MFTGCGNKVGAGGTNKGGANTKMKKGRIHLPAEKEERRMTLYKQGLSDTEIAERLGLTRMAICRWRERRGLPPNVLVDKPKKKEIWSGVRMEKALPPEKCTIMKKFLHDLAEYAKMLPAGVKPDVSAFIREWRQLFSYSCSEPGRTVKKRRSF